MESHFRNTLRSNEINYDEGLDPAMLVKIDAFSLQIYIQNYLLSHSGSGEGTSYKYKNEVAKDRQIFLKMMPDKKEIELPVFTPDLTPHKYMNQVMTELKRLSREAWAHDHVTIWLHDKLLKQNLFRRPEFDTDSKRPDPCLVIKKTGRMTKDRFERTFLCPFEPDIDAEQVCVQFRRFLRFLQQNLGRSRILNVMTGYHTTLIKKSKTQAVVDTYTLTTPVQLGIHPVIHEYVRNFAPNQMFTIHLGNPLPGLMTLDNYVRNDSNPNEPPIIISDSSKSIIDETEDEAVNMDRYNNRQGTLYD